MELRSLTLNYLKTFSRFFVFNNVWIGLCAVSMMYATRWFFAIPFKIDALAFFIFFSTFFDYNFHKTVWHFNSTPIKILKQLLKPDQAVVLGYSTIVGFIGTFISFLFLDKEIMVLAVISSVITFAYSFPFIRWKNKYIRLRELTYLKVFAVALVWSFVTVIIPLINIPQHFSSAEIAIIFIRRFIFIYAITIPFEIREIETEKAYGNLSLPMIYGIRKMKITGVVFMALFCVLAAVQEKYFEFDIASRKSIFYPLIVSAILSGLLILFYSSRRNEWYNKFLIDGMMFLQLALLVVFNF